jgi:hypothetical protein
MSTPESPYGEPRGTEPPIEGKPYNGDPSLVADPTMASTFDAAPPVGAQYDTGPQQYAAEPPQFGAGQPPYGAEPPQQYAPEPPYGLGQPPTGGSYYAEPPQGQPYYPDAPPPQYAQAPYPPAPYQPQQPPYPYPYAPPQPTNGMAIAAMVLGILWIYWIGSILALIFGYVARAEIKRTNQGGDGMAIAGIVLGWVGVGILCIVLISLGVSAAT